MTLETAHFITEIHMPGGMINSALSYIVPSESPATAVRACVGLCAQEQTCVQCAHVYKESMCDVHKCVHVHI